MTESSYAQGRTEDESPDRYATEVANLLHGTNIFEIVEVKAGAGQIHLMGRVKGASQKRFLSKVVEPVLYAVEGKCKEHVGTQYFLRNGKTRYGWVMSFTSKDLAAVAEAIRGVLEPSQGEIMEAPLMGPGTPQSGGQRSGRKGAAPLRG